MLSHYKIDPVTLGQRLTEARKDAGKTQQEMADCLGCSRPVVIAIEKGTRPVKPEEMIKLASLYKRSLHELVRPGQGALALEPHLRGAVDTSRTDVGQVNEAVRILEALAEDYRELEAITGAPLTVNYQPESPVPGRTRVEAFAEDVAGRERARLLLGDQPILNLRRILETYVGIRIFCGAMPSAIAGMYAYVPDLGYCILINRLHPPERKRASLAREYGHFMCSRHQPGIDYLNSGKPKPTAERFAEAFGMCFLMPQGGLRRQFHEIVQSRGDFQVADLCRLGNFYGVSVQALTLRLEQLGLVDRGTWDYLLEKGLKVQAMKSVLDLQSSCAESDEAYPERYKYLAVQAFQEEKISEGQLARFLRCDRVHAREIVEECLSQLEIDSEGNPSLYKMEFHKSLLPARR